MAKPIQYCKVISLQLKQINLKKKNKFKLKKKKERKRYTENKPKIIKNLVIGSYKEELVTLWLPWWLRG